MNDENPLIFKFPQVYIVEASAGSGKTFALAKRYIQLLINPHLAPEEIPISNILAITFTNKAAIEMKERILEFLKKMALGLSENEPTRKKASGILDYLIRNYNFFQVQTIDSFINTILFSCAFKLNLSSGFRTREDHRQYLAYSLDTLIDAADKDENLKNLFRNFLAHYLSIDNKTGWFPKQNILSVSTSLYSHYNKYPGRFTVNEADSRDLPGIKKSILKTINDLNKNMPAGVDGRFLKFLNSFSEKNKDGFSLDKISDFFKRQDVPMNKGYITPEETKKLWNSIKTDIRRLCETESAALYNCYIEIFDKILNNLEILSAKEDVLFLEELNKKVNGLFDSADFGVPELYSRLATNFKHFLIDEFQDTSRLQWENLFIMIEDALSQGGSLFYVGDRKQAIYRFRGGSVSLFESVKTAFKDSNLIEEPLNLNYRSQKEIVQFNNMVFSEANLNRFFVDTGRQTGLSVSDVDEIAEIFKNSAQDYKQDKPNGYVKLEFMDCRDKQEQRDILRPKVIALIKELNKTVPLKDIAILVRKNKEVELLTLWLIQEGIPVESEKTLNIKENSFVKEIFSFLEFLNSPIDNLSFASFLLGDIFLKASGLERSQMQDFLFDLRDKSRKGAYLYTEFRTKFPAIWQEFIGEFFKNIDLIPLYELVISIFGKFNVMQNFPEYQGFFMRFLEIVKDQEREASGVSYFIEFFNNINMDDNMLYAVVAESNSVKINTIHKAKGLEFSVVILPFMEINVKPNKELIISDQENIRLFYLKEKYADFSPFLAKFFKEQYIKSFIDELNNAYVALTRAKNELYIFISSKSENSNNLASFLFPDDKTEYGSKYKYKEDGKKSFSLSGIPPSCYKDWITFLKDEFTGEDVLYTPSKTLRGKILHYVLSFIDNLHDKDMDPVIDQAFKNVPMQFPFVTDVNEYRPIIKRLLNRVELKRFFEVSDGRIYLEKEFVTAKGETKRVDRLILKQKEAWVIDYKSAKDTDNKYRQQIEEYMKIIKDIYPDLKIRGFLIYLDEFIAEEINGKDNNLQSK